MEAIDRLDQERASRLTTAEAAACLGRGYNSAISNLRKFRKEVKCGEGWHEAKATAGSAPTTQGGAETVSEKRGRAGEAGGCRYDRDSLKRWWEREHEKRSLAAGRRARDAHERSKSAEQAARDALIDRLMRGGVSHDTIMGALRGTAPWLVNARGFIVDSLALPQRTAPEIAQVLADGGRGAGISLFDAITAWDWEDDAVLAPWHDLFVRLLHDAERAAQVTRLKIRERRMHGE